MSLVTTAFSNVDDGTFNSLAQQGAMAACSSNSKISCCLEIDMPNTTDTTDYYRPPRIVGVQSSRGEWGPHTQCRSVAIFRNGASWSLCERLTVRA